MKINLRLPNLRELNVGDVVTTSKGFDFELISKVDGKETWKDITSKLIWFPKENGSFNYHEAMEKFGSSLPNIEEFRLSNEHGFIEVIPDMNFWFWSASLDPDVTDFAQEFNGNNGFSDYGSRNSGNSVRCVGR